MEKEKLVFEAIDRENAKRKSLSEAMDKAVKNNRAKRLEEIEQTARKRAEEIANQEYYRIKNELLKEANLPSANKNDNIYKEWARNMGKTDRKEESKEKELSALEQLEQLLK